ncbi:MAG TPA: fibronectin type III domain-containing protein, partial [Anaeromyxobacteraceae bacterium]|nr:fibronectin type III domain-containing protein [Anaeromyxobacteraceae bacterium]
MPASLWPCHAETTMVRTRLTLTLVLAILAGCGGSERPPPGPPAAPLHVEASPGDGMVTLRWDPASGADSYVVYWSNASGVSRSNGTPLPSQELILNHEGLENGVTYFYVVTAVNEAGESAESTEVFATPLPSHYPLAVAKQGSGAGTVVSSPAAIDCGDTCSFSVPRDTSITLTASPDATSTFDGWSGDCSGTDPCTVTMDAARSVTATFTRITHGLTVSRTGTGGGAVTSSPAGIDCGATCSTTFDAATVVTLTATPDATSDFTGWSGACAGASATCTVTMDAALSVTATFTRITHALGVSRTAGGTVSSSPSGIDCGSTCSASFDAGTVVTLTASPAAGATFAGW